MSTPYLVQVGTLNLQLESGPSQSENTPWVSLSVDVLETFTVRDEYLEPVTALAALLRHPGIELAARYRIRKDTLVIRISLLPSDGLGSVWKQVVDRSAMRRRSLSQLFRHLQDDWDGGGAFLLANKVSWRHTHSVRLSDNRVRWRITDGCQNSMPLFPLLRALLSQKRRSAYRPIERSLLV